MRKRVKCFPLTLISFAFFLILAATPQGAVYGQCSNGKVLVQKTNKKGKVHFICVSPNAVKGLIKSKGVTGVWGIHLMKMDNESDGSIDQISYYDSNDEGRTIAVEHDGPPIDGTIDSAYFWEYDADGNRILREEDTDYDGTLDNAVFYAWDADGNKISELYDSGYDGSIEQSYHYEYDNQNRLTLTTHINTVVPANEFIQERTYLPGNQVLIETDDLGDGSLDHVERWYEYFDTNGNRIRREIDDLDDTYIDRIVYWTWSLVDGTYRWVRWDYDLDNDGVIDRTYLQDFDQFGHLSVVEMIIPANPTDDYIQYYTWILK